MSESLRTDSMARPARASGTGRTEFVPRLARFGKGLVSPSPTVRQLYMHKVWSLPVRYLRLIWGVALGDRTDRGLLLRQLGRVPGLSWAVGNRLESVQSYLAMQRGVYERAASAELVRPGNIVSDFVIGSWREHDAWADYEDYLMADVPRDASWVALDFGCGPGRNIRRWSERFARVDGVDISRANLANAEVFLRGQVSPAKRPLLYLASGSDCGAAQSSQYDFIFSTICLQHICVHSARQEIFRDMFRCLKLGGLLSIQMGYGVPSPDTVDYFADFIEAQGTNRACDVAVETPQQVADDLALLGFVDFKSTVRPVGPGDRHPQWIFFAARKPHYS